MDREKLIITEHLNNLKAPTQNDGFLQKGRRRSKKDKVNRNFICGCGKTYLSYPALYTHIKNKHNSTPPSGTIVHSINKLKAKSKKSDNDGFSDISKPEKSKAARDEFNQRNENLSQIDDDGDFMKDKKFGGNLIKKGYKDRQVFVFEYAVEDFELINLLGSQGETDSGYSFSLHKLEKVTLGLATVELENMLKLVQLRIQKIEQSLAGPKERKEVLIPEHASKKSSLGFSSDSDSQQELILTKDQKPSNEPMHGWIKLGFQNRAESDKKLATDLLLLKNLKESRDRVKQQIAEKRLNSSDIGLGLFSKKDQKGQIFRRNINPLYHIINEGNSQLDQ